MQYALHLSFHSTIYDMSIGTQFRDLFCDEMTKRKEGVIDKIKSSKTRI